MLVALSANVSANPTLQCPHMLLHPPSLPSDFGLAEELTPPVRHHFISFLHMISCGELGKQPLCIMKPAAGAGAQVLLGCGKRAALPGRVKECHPRATRATTLPWHTLCCAGDGRRAAEHLLQWSVNQRCPDPEVFTAGRWCWCCTKPFIGSSLQCRQQCSFLWTGRRLRTLFDCLPSEPL